MPRRPPRGLALHLAALLLAALPTHSRADGPDVATPERYSLENGLSVVLDPIPGRSTVAVVVSVDAGRRDQPEGWTGLAHLTEHLLFQGTPAAPGETITRLERLGASSINGETSDDWTRYYEVVPAARLERTLWIEAERFSHGLDGLDEDGVDQQRRVLDREREIREIGREEVWTLIDSILYPEGHPYSRAAEQRDDVHAARLADVRWFFQRFYMPDRLTLSLSGGFDPAEARAWIERYFGPLRRGGIAAPPATTRPPPIRFEGERRVLAEARRSDDALYVMWPSPPWGEAGDAELDFIARELDHRLEDRLVRDGDALSVRVWQGSRSLGSTFRVWIEVPRRSGTLAPLTALDEEVARLRENGLDAGSLAAWRESWIEDELVSMESSLTRAKRNARVAIGFPNGVWDQRANLARYQSVDAEGVHEAARRYLLPHRRLVVSIASRHDAPAEGRIVTDMTVDQ